MLNWSRQLLIQGVTTVNMLSNRALGQCFDVSTSREASRSQGHPKQIIFCLQGRAHIYTTGGQGLPQATPAPLVHIEEAAGTLTFTQAIV